MPVQCTKYTQIAYGAFVIKCTIFLVSEFNTIVFKSYFKLNRHICHLKGNLTYIACRNIVLS